MQSMTKEEKLLQCLIEEIQRSESIGKCWDSNRNVSIFVVNHQGNETTRTKPDSLRGHLEEISLLSFENDKCFVPIVNRCSSSKFYSRKSIQQNELLCQCWNNDSIEIGGDNLAINLLSKCSLTISKSFPRLLREQLRKKVKKTSLELSEKTKNPFSLDFNQSPNIDNRTIWTEFRDEMIRSKIDLPTKKKLFNTRNRLRCEQRNRWNRWR